MVDAPGQFRNKDVNSSGIKIMSLQNTELVK
jgi:hypothetical protein